MSTLAGSFRTRGARRWPWAPPAWGEAPFYPSRALFGPVLSMIPFKDFETGVAEGNASFYGLAAAVWTRDVAKALKAVRALRAGTVWVNAYNLYDAALPFGGFKQSGFGRELGTQGLDLYTEVKSVWHSRSRCLTPRSYLAKMAI